MSTIAPLADELFYPSDPAALTAEIDNLMKMASSECGPAAPPLGIVPPHGAYRFTGPLMARAYAQSAEISPEWILLIAPVHGDETEGIYLPPGKAFKTPLGEVQVYREGVNLLRDAPLFSEGEIPYGEEIALEVQLPFIQRLFPRTEILPLYVGGKRRRVEKALGAGLKRLSPPPLTIITSNLSPYEARRISHPKAEEFIEAVNGPESFDPRYYSSHRKANLYRPCGLTSLAGFWEYRKGDAYLKTLGWGSDRPGAEEDQKCAYYGAFRIEGER